MPNGKTIQTMKTMLGAKYTTFTARHLPILARYSTLYIAGIRTATPRLLLSIVHWTPYKAGIKRIHHNYVSSHNVEKCFDNC